MEVVSKFFHKIILGRDKDIRRYLGIVVNPHGNMSGIARNSRGIERSEG